MLKNSWIETHKYKQQQQQMNKDYVELYKKNVLNKIEILKKRRSFEDLAFI